MARVDRILRQAMQKAKRIVDGSDLRHLTSETGGPPQIALPSLVVRPGRVYRPSSVRRLAASGAGYRS